jgi:hypothetical protein
MSDKEIQRLVKRLVSPHALVTAEAPVKAELRKAGLRHKEILRLSRERAPRWIFG